MPSDERRRAAARDSSLSLSLSLPERYSPLLHPSGGNREYSITPSPSSPLSSMAASSSILQPTPLTAHIPLGHVRVHAIVVVTDTSRGLTCHTRSAVHLPSTGWQAPRWPPPPGIPPPPSLHPSFGPPGCIGTPAAIAVGRHRWCTGPLTSSIHSYRPLLSHRERISLSLSLPRAFTSLLCPPCVASHSPVFLHPSPPPVRTKRRVVCARRNTSSTVHAALLRLLLSPSTVLQLCNNASTCQHRARVFHGSSRDPVSRQRWNTRSTHTRFDRLVSLSLSVLRIVATCARRWACVLYDVPYVRWR